MKEVFGNLKINYRAANHFKIIRNYDNLFCNLLSINSKSLVKEELENNGFKIVLDS